MINFAEIRKSKGYKQEELAKMADVSIRTIGNFESYEKVVSKGNASRILNALQLDITYEEYYADRKQKNPQSDYFIIIIIYK